MDTHIKKAFWSYLFFGGCRGAFWLAVIELLSLRSPRFLEREVLSVLGFFSQAFLFWWLLFCLFLLLLGLYSRSLEQRILTFYLRREERPKGARYASYLLRQVVTGEHHLGGGMAIAYCVFRFFFFLFIYTLGASVTPFVALLRDVRGHSFSALKGVSLSIGDLLAAPYSAVLLLWLLFFIGVDRVLNGYHWRKCYDLGAQLNLRKKG